MIKSLFSKIAQSILIISLVYAGSFMLMEETSEKTEKTEKSEEALHSIYHSNAFMRALEKAESKKKWNSSSNPDHNKVYYADCPTISDFNINFIYTTSFLDSII